MPKTGKKGKKDGKSGKKGGGKKKMEEKPEKDVSIKAMAIANSDIWEARLKLTEQSRLEHREHARFLALENDSLQTQVEQTEKDTIDVVTYLKHQDEEKDKKIDRLLREIEENRVLHDKQKERIATDFQLKISNLEQSLNEKTEEVELIREELRTVKEFRRRRAQMQKELLEIKESMLEASEEHKDTVTLMETRFFEEKMKLQKEANSKIAELAERAHSEAILNLDETTKSVYKENVRLARALTLHTQEGEELKKIRSRLEKENKLLKESKEIDDQLIQQKVVQTKRQKKLIAELEEKVSTLESSLSLCVQEFDAEQMALVARTRAESESSREEVSRLQRMIELKTKETNRVKKLAKNILDQRTDVERFLLDSLQHVKEEIAANRLQYRRDAEAVYQQKMLDAYVGKIEFPRIRTFNRSEASTNSVYRDLEAAEQLMDVTTSRVDIRDLTWEQKEKVLRHLFARMNSKGAAGQQQRKKSTSSLTLHSIGGAATAASLTGDDATPCIKDKEAWTEEQRVSPKPTHDPAFVTEAVVDQGGNFERLPRIDITSASEAAWKPLSSSETSATSIAAT